MCELSVCSSYFLYSCSSLIVLVCPSYVRLNKPSFTLICVFHHKLPEPSKGNAPSSCEAGRHWWSVITSAIPFLVSIPKSRPSPWNINDKTVVTPWENKACVLANWGDLNEDCCWWHNGCHSFFRLIRKILLVITYRHTLPYPIIPDWIDCLLNGIW